MWYPASSVIGVPSVYAVGGSHESVKLSPVVCGPAAAGALAQDEPEEGAVAPEPAAEEVVAVEVVAVEAVVVEAVVVEAAVTEVATEEVVVVELVRVESVVVDDSCTIDGAAGPSAEGELELSEDDPLPHAVSIPPASNETATNSVHERTPVLLIGTPRQTTPFSNATRTTQSYSSNGFGALMLGGLPEADGREAAIAF